MVKETTYTNFIYTHIKSLPSEFRWQRTPVQVYPLDFISKYLILPTPLLKADYHFIVYLSKGSFYQQVGIETYHVTSLSVLFVPEGEAFSIKSVGDDLCGFFILLENKTVTAITGKMELTDFITINTKLVPDAQSNDWINSLCKLLFAEVSSENPQRNIGSGLLQALLFKLKDLSGSKKVFSRQNEVANRFKNLVTKHYQTKKALAFYAQELNVSENYLNRCVRSRFNKSCKKVIQETTILQSQILMFNSTKDIGEISLEVGYDDRSYFSRLFKKITGVTPTEFKKQIMHGLS
ncbi:helix-turn-helix domain-containing protein [Saccharicrinis sp. FJH54]|uniref:helix-turn-helix domain-containing protein n=1 Tax=Saccharicrinis sp. FJH54 TaxID=3344665 RepID=UPI0035D45950